MHKGYLIAHIRIRDEAAFERFRTLSSDAISQHGGRVLVRDPEPDHREGGAEGLAIVIEFDSPDAARAFYESDAYAEARAAREAASDADLVLARGPAP